MIKGVYLTMRRIILNTISSVTGFAVLYLAAIMPNLRKKPGIGLLLDYDYAHRGLHNNKAGIPENSLTAFDKAAVAGYGIELDVQLTKDKIPVVFHDSTLDRVCGVAGRLADHTYEELTAFRLYGTGELIPRLEQVLELVAGRVPLIVEMKIELTDTGVCEAADEILRKYEGVYCIESFNPIGLLWYRKNNPAVVRGQLSKDFFRHGEKEENTLVHRALKNLLFNFLTKPDFIAYDYKGAKCLSRRICRYLYKNLSVAYTIKSQQQLDKYSKDFDLFIFEQFEPQVGKAMD